jgi:hypothetical protein
MIGQHESTGEVVDSHQVELTSGWEAAYVAIQKRYRDSRLSQVVNQFPIHLLPMFDVLERGEEHAGHFPVDEPPADLSRIIDAVVGVQPWMCTATRVAGGLRLTQDVHLIARRCPLRPDVLSIRNSGGLAMRGPPSGEIPQNGLPVVPRLAIGLCD